MRLSPKPVFFGLFLLGLPVAVAAGWNLVSSDRPQSPGGPTGDVVDGSGRLGAAPAGPSSPAARSGIVNWTPVAVTEPPAVVVPLPVAGTVVSSRPPAAPRSVTPGTSASSSSSPSIEPPVPTPTMITVAPPAPSVTPSVESADPEPPVTAAPEPLPTP